MYESHQKIMAAKFIDFELSKTSCEYCFSRNENEIKYVFILQQAK